MKKIILFLRSQNAPLMALTAQIFGLFQMYAKSYYIVNPLKVNPIVDITISLIVAFGFSIATTIVIIHTKNKNAPIAFAIFDFIGYLLFFSSNFQVWWANSEISKIAITIFISLLSSGIIYYIGDIFIQELKEKLKEFESNQTIANELNEQIAGLKDKVFNLGSLLNDSKFENEANNIVIDNLKDDCQEYLNTIEQLKIENSELNIQLSNLKDRLNKLESQKDVFMTDNSPEKLKETLKGKKAAFRRAMNEGRLETAKTLQTEMIKMASILHIELEEYFKQSLVYEEVQ